MMMPNRLHGPASEKWRRHCWWTGQSMRGVFQRFRDLDAIGRTAYAHPDGLGRLPENYFSNGP
jgi:hypothetical protein